MGEEVRGVLEAPALGADGEQRDEAPASIGRYLASQRRLRGISLADLADLTKIPLRSLERLESGAFDRTPDGFARGFVRTVAAALGLDPDEAVMRLMREPAEAEEERRRRGSPTRALALSALRWALAAVAAAALFKLGVVWLAPADPAKGPGPVLRRDPVRALAAEEQRRHESAPAR